MKTGEAYDWLIEQGFARRGPVGSPIESLSQAIAVAVALGRKRGIAWEEFARSMSAVEIARLK
jgi:hypothetical protein